VLLELQALAKQIEGLTVRVSEHPSGKFNVMVGSKLEIKGEDGRYTEAFLRGMISRELNLLSE